MRVLMLATVLFCLTGTSCWAATANEILDSCETFLREGRDLGASRRWVSNGAMPCWYHLQGIQELSALVDRPDHFILGICLPIEGQLTQLIRVFIEYARKNPALLHEPAAMVELRAFRDAFPCP